MTNSPSGIKDQAIGRVDMYRMAYGDLHIKPGWNCRDLTTPENMEHVDAIAQSIAKVGQKEALTIYWEDGKAFLSDGHCRHAAIGRAMEVYGADIKSVLCKPEERYSNAADRSFSKIVRNAGKTPSPYEQGLNFKEMLGHGWSDKDISEKSGLKLTHIRFCLELQAAPSDVAQLVREGSVSASLAMDTLKAAKGDGKAAAAKLGDAVATAKAAGKTRATAQHMKKAPKPAKPDLMHDLVKDCQEVATAYLAGDTTADEAMAHMIARLDSPQYRAAAGLPA